MLIDYQALPRLLVSGATAFAAQRTLNSLLMNGLLVGHSAQWFLDVFGIIAGLSGFWIAQGMVPSSQHRFLGGPVRDVDEGNEAKIVEFSLTRSKRLCLISLLPTIVLVGVFIVLKEVSVKDWHPSADNVAVVFEADSTQVRTEGELFAKYGIVVKHEDGRYHGTFILPFGFPNTQRSADLLNLHYKYRDGGSTTPLQATLDENPIALFVAINDEDWQKGLTVAVLLLSQCATLVSAGMTIGFGFSIIAEVVGTLE